MDFTQRIRDIMNDRLARREETLTIAAGANDSGELNCKNGVMLAAKILSGMDATNVYVKVRDDSGNYTRLADNYDVDAAFTKPSSDRWMTLDNPALLLPYQHVKLESDATGGETNAQDIKVKIRHLS